MTTFQLLLSVFGVIFVAELPDKTALAALVLATHYEPLPVFLGAGLALTVQSVVAVAAGGLLSTLPTRTVHVGAGVLFLVCAVLSRAGRGLAVPSPAGALAARASCWSSAGWWW